MIMMIDAYVVLLQKQELCQATTDFYESNTYLGKGNRLFASTIIHRYCMNCQARGPLGKNY